MDIVKITALSNRKPKILNNFVRKGWNLFVRSFSFINSFSNLDGRKE